MKLTVANANITNTLSTARITLGNASVVQSLTLGNVSVAPSQISVGNTSITPTVVSVPALVLGGSQFAGGLQGGIINYQEFTANGTWYNPYANASVNSSLTGYEQVLIMAWGGGGGGASGASLEGGGGGGACFIGVSSLNDLTSTCSVNVGSGGAAGLAGGNSIFVCNSSSTITAYGGGGAQRDGGGGGGGLLSAGLTATADNGAVGGSPLNSTSSTYGGGDGSNNSSGSVGGTSIFGGGGGGGSKTTGLGGISIYGGAGGSYGIVNSTVSIFGGRGGNNTVAPTTPGGGASGQTNLTGARGEVRVWVFGPAGTTAGAPTYTLTGNTNTLYEGSSILYTVATTNIPNGTILYYNINSSSQVTSSDLTSYTGSFIINGGVGSFLITANTSYTNNINRSLIIDVKNNSTSGPVVLSNTVTLLGAVNKFSTANQSTTFVVPSGVSSILIKAWGAGGCADGSTSGGGGGYSTATISVTAGESLTVYVPTSGVTTSGYGGPGGSFAGVFRSTTPLIIAGGGGGGGKDGGSVNGADGGGGGGTTGEDGYSAPTGGGGGGGTQSAGGAGGSSQGGAPGEAGETDGRYYGGDGGSIAGLSGIPGYNGLAEGGIGGVIQNGGGGGGGGGAGYYGGGGGGRGDGGGNRGGGGGGGGSGYVSGTNTLLQRATGRPCANTTDIDYNGSAGVGGSPGDNSGSNGYVVIRGVS